MSGKKIFLVLILVIILTIVVTLFITPILAARLATVPFVERYGLYHPQAPIVITKRETIRVSDTNDALETVNQAKSRLVALFSLDNNKTPVISGSAVSLTNDGYFITVRSALPPVGTDYFISMPDGSVVPVTKLFVDPASDLVIINAKASSQSVINFGRSAELEPGQKLFLLNASLQQNRIHFKQSYVAVSQIETQSEMNIDYPSRSFGITENSSPPGTVMVSLGGDLAGLWTGTKIVSSDIIKNFTENFFSNQKQIIRPAFGFSYRSINSAESQLNDVPQGAFITSLAANGKALSSGIAIGDIITKVNEESLDDKLSLEELLQKLIPGQKARLTVIRSGQPLIIEISPGSFQVE